ncbi:hypothetical protein BGZ49_001631 [Haplosporangium sp. Z 27]|nr:hypothetical protein BGZ49_001631 [Haplosporangium sp. Z 27]
MNADQDSEHDEIDSSENSNSANVEMTSNTKAASSGNAKQRMKRMTLNDAQKYEICVYMKEEEEKASRPTNKAVTAYILSTYNIKVDESTVSRLKQQAEKRLAGGNLSNPNAKRHRQVAFPELERQLGEFVKANKRKVAISDMMLLNKGKELRDILEIPEQQMKFSDGWLNKFKIRHGLKTASVQKTVRANPSTSNKRPASSGNNNNSSSSSTPIERPRQPSALPTAIEPDPVEVSIQSSLSSTHLNDSTTDETPDVDMDIGTGMDVDSPDNEAGIIMEQVLSRQPSNANDLIVNPDTSRDASVIRMDLLSNVYPTSSSSSGAIPIESQQQQAPRLLVPNTSRNTSNTSTSAATNQTPSSQLDNHIPIAINASSSVNTDHLSSLELTEATHSSGGANSEGNTVTVVPTPPPMTAARESLNMRMADPIAAAFQPEPLVDFAEASQCVNTLRIFMQQQNYSNEQLENLRNIYLTLDSKRKQHQQQQISIK